MLVRYQLLIEVRVLGVQDKVRVPLLLQELHQFLVLQVLLLLGERLLLLLYLLFLFVTVSLDFFLSGLLLVWSTSLVISVFEKRFLFIVRAEHIFNFHVLVVFFHRRVALVHQRLDSLLFAL